MGTKWNVFTNNFDLVNSVDTLVEGPAVSTDNAIARFDGTTGKVLQNSGSTLSDADVLSTGELNVTTDVAVQYGGTGRSDATEYAVICGGTTTTGAHQSIASVGTAAQVLTSNGPGALPTFQAAAGGSSPTTTQGDIIQRGASADERVALGGEGSYLISDGTDTVWYDNSKHVLINKYFTQDNGETSYNARVSGGSALYLGGARNSGTTGAIRLEVSTTGHYASYSTDNAIAPASGFKLGGGAIVFECGFELEGAQDGTDQASLKFGFQQDANDGPGTDGIFFEWDYGLHTSNNWFCIELDGSVRNAEVDSGVAIVANDTTYHYLRIEINADATEAKFYVDRSLVSTETMSMTGTAVTPCIDIKQTAGTDRYRVYIDFFKVFKKLTSAKY
jgi:hypothetical protein